MQNIRNPHKRRGSILIIALVCLVLISLLLATLLKTAVQQRQQLRYEEQHLQAVWLSESGVERAASRLAADRAYAGETWHIPAAELHGPSAAEVKINVMRADNMPNRRTVAVEAVYPSGAIPFSKQTKQVNFDLPPEP